MAVKNINLLLLSALFLLLTFKIYSQTSSPMEVKVEGGRTVILKPDHTWEFKKSVQSTGKVSVAQIEDFIRREFGDQVKVETALNDDPSYLFGDFNGDKYPDIVVLVNVEQGREELKKHRVKYINTDPYSRTNGSELDPVSKLGANCLGMAIIHGTEGGWNVSSPAAKYLIYDCFSSFKLFRKGQVIRRGSGSEGLTPKPKGDSIFLDLETGGTALVYWNGQTYRGFGLRGGD